LIDTSGDWIYCEFVNSAATSPDVTLTPAHITKHLEIDSFNICVESFTSPNRSNNKNNNINPKRAIFSLQLSIAKCRFITNNDSMGQIAANSFTNDDSRISFVKTDELLRLFEPASAQTLVNDTFDECDQQLPGPATADQHTYLFRVVHAGQVYSLAHSQFRRKLRADVRVELIEINNLNEIKTVKSTPRSCLLALVSKFLFYHAFMKAGEFHLLKSQTRLQINSVANNKENCSLSTLVVVDDTMRINLLSNDDDSERTKQLRKLIATGQIFKSINSVVANEVDDAELVNSLSGVLVEKRLFENVDVRRLEQRELDESLTGQFDLMLPNREFKLVMRCGDNATFVTVYYNTNYSVYPLAALPGLFYFKSFLQFFPLNDVIVKLKSLAKRSQYLQKLRSLLTHRSNDKTGRA
jgi:hypothetical protein